MHSPADHAALGMQDNRRDDERRDCPSIEVMTRQAYAALAECGLSVAKIRRLVHSLEREVAESPSLPDPLLVRIIAYSDPTGETAVRHVMAISA